jgi:hypothetical protein
MAARCRTMIVTIRAKMTAKNTDGITNKLNFKGSNK